MLKGAIKAHIFPLFSVSVFETDSNPDWLKIKSPSSQGLGLWVWAAMSDINFFSTWEPSFPSTFQDQHGYRLSHWHSLIWPIHWFHLHPSLLCHRQAYSLSPIAVVYCPLAHVFFFLRQFLWSWRNSPVRYHFCSLTHGSATRNTEWFIAVLPNPTMLVSYFIPLTSPALPI